MTFYTLKSDPNIGCNVQSESHSSSHGSWITFYTDEHLTAADQRIDMPRWLFDKVWELADAPQQENLDKWKSLAEELREERDKAVKRISELTVDRDAAIKRADETIYKERKEWNDRVEQLTYERNIVKNELAVAEEARDQWKEKVAELQIAQQTDGYDRSPPECLFCQLFKEGTEIDKEYGKHGRCHLATPKNDFPMRWKDDFCDRFQRKAG